jgi:uncharacterized protein with predicted RNA binding PUA domain
MIKIRPSRETIERLREIADYQFRPGVGERLIREDSLIIISKNTGRIRGVEDSEGLVLTVRASDMRLIPTCIGGERIRASLDPPLQRVVVINEVAEDIGSGRNVFARHVLDIDPELRSWDEVVVVNENDRLIGVGRLVLSPAEALHYIRGVAVIIREGCWRFLKKEEM